MDYLDFELHIGAGADAKYPVTVIHAAAGGEPSLTTLLPVNDVGLRRQVDELIAARHAHAMVQRRVFPSRRYDSSSLQIDEAATARETGQRLFEALITGTVRDAYSSSLLKAREQGWGLRLRLRIEAPEVAGLPWEFLYDPQEGDHISLLRETPLTRYTALTRDSDMLFVKPPLRILGMVATPSDLDRLDVAHEQVRIERALEYRLERGDVEIEWVQGQTWEALQRALDRGPWHVFHFIGHGGFDSATGEGLLAFCDERGATQRLSATLLGRLFSGYPSLRLAFLNACEGGRTSDVELFSSVGAILTRRGVPAVISMQFEITDAAALEFARLFYDALARGSPVDVAVTEARTGVSISLPKSIEWATPMLHMRSVDARLFAMDAGAAIFDERKPIPQPAAGAATFRQSAANPGAASEPIKRSLRGLDILRRKVQQYWIDGFLAQSLFHQTLYDLGLEMLQSAVESPWGTQVERPGEPSTPLTQGQSLADVFADYGRSLLILGEPGSGKTTAMLNLTRTLLQRIAHDVGGDGQRAAPVIFTLSAWSPEFALLEDYLAAQMSLQYQIPRVDGHNLLAAGNILPMLDGLDETDSTLRARCVEAINGYVLERNLTGLVVCCRIKEYTALPVRLALNTAIRLTELNDDQVDSHLAAVGEPLAGLRALLRHETAMRFDARSPLWLNLMVRAYQGLSIDDLAQEGEGTAAARRRQLLNDYIARMYRKARGDA